MKISGALPRAFTIGRIVTHPCSSAASGASPPRDGAALAFYCPDCGEREFGDS
jgi:hypothetical protein